MRTLALCLALATALTAAESAGGVKWTVPAGWKPQPDRPMRAATYGVAEEGECAVFYFGEGQGGSVDANIKRWVGQFEPDAPAKTSKATVNGMSVTRIDLSGKYKTSAGPMMQSTGTKPGYRLLGAIVEAPQGNVFFKFTGPAKTVAAQQANFEKLIKSVSK